MSERQRLFFGLRPGRDVRFRLHRLVAGHLLRSRPVPPENYHVTLVFLGSCDPQQRELACVAAGTVRARPVRLSLTRLEHWRRPRILVLTGDAPAPALRELHAGLYATLANRGFELEARAFRPHLTLARRADRREAVSLAPQRLAFGEFHLLESVSGNHGPRYQSLRCWPLG